MYAIGAELDSAATIPSCYLLLAPPVFPSSSSELSHNYGRKVSTSFPLGEPNLDP